MRNHDRTDSTNADGFRRFEVITGVGRRRRWSDEDKARIVAESLDPATSASAVARRYGLHASQLFAWRQQLQRRAAATVALGEQVFVPVLLAEDGPAPPEPAGRMEIALGSVVVRVGADVDGPALRRVLEVVRGLA
jgi:transposase